MVFTVQRAVPSGFPQVMYPVGVVPGPSCVGRGSPRPGSSWEVQDGRGGGVCGRGRPDSPSDGFFLGRCIWWKESLGRSPPLGRVGIKVCPKGLVLFAVAPISAGGGVHCQRIAEALSGDLEVSLDDMFNICRE